MKKNQKAQKKKLSAAGRKVKHVNKGASSKPQASSELTVKQDAFCREYVVDMNGTAAAVRAGYSDDNARQQASRMLTKANIKARIDELLKIKNDKLDITAEKILKEFARIAFGDLRKLYHEDGRLKEVRELDDEGAAILSAIEVDELYSDHKKIGYTKKVKLHNKLQALESLAKHLGLYQKDNEQGKNEAVIIYLPDDGRNKNA